MHKACEGKRDISALESVLRLLNARRDDGYRILIGELQAELTRLLSESRAETTTDSGHDLISH